MTSPTPHRSKPETMTFMQAIEQINQGQKVTRVEWDSPEEYGFMGKDGFLSIHRSGVDHRWLVNDGDMLATDWILV